MNFKHLFRPESMAVIGVSLHNNRHPANIVYRKNRLRYPVKVFAVNPKGGTLQGEPVFERPGDIPEKVDLAVIAVRADRLPDTMAQCIAAGVGGAVIISGGFAEVGQTELQDQLVEMAREADFPFIGPNCLGIFSPGYVDTFFLPPERTVQPAPGNIALVSQSGGVLVDQMINFAGEGVGLSVGISIGNKALVDEVALLEYLNEDPNTDAIAFYLEGFNKNGGRKFVEAACHCQKPIVALKSGKSPEGGRAVSSHTASLAGDYAVFSQVMAQFGVIEARTQFELVSFCESLSCYQNTIEGKIGIITGSGGHGALTVDFCATHGLKAPLLSKALQSELTQRLSPNIQPIAATGNPVDLTGSAVDDDFVAAADVLSQSPEVDCLVLLVLPYSPGTTSDLGARLSEVYQREGKPMVAYVPSLQRYRMLIEGFELNHIPVSPAIEGVVLMASAMRRRSC
ncbi:MAG: CoA-binding protein [Desulfobacteraceae bacterium 4572_87]|nr:MAG: CoA-binding protein [Desulfobacteraceae bacterium 4572_87]